MHKTIHRSEDLYIQFTDEELASLNIKPGDKFSWEIDSNKESLILKKFVPVEIDLSEFSRETLIFLVTESIEKDLSVNDVICNVLQQAIDSSVKLDEDR